MRSARTGGVAERGIDSWIEALSAVMQTLKPPIVVKRVGTFPDSGCQYMVIRFHSQGDWTFPYGVRSSVIHEDLKVEQKFSRWQCECFFYDTL